MTEACGPSWGSQETTEYFARWGKVTDRLFQGQRATQLTGSRGPHRSGARSGPERRAGGAGALIL